MYHSNIVEAKSQGVIGQEKVGVNIISNPMAELREAKLKITNIIAARDLQISSAKENSPVPKLPKIETAHVIIPDTLVKVEQNTERLPFVVPNVERSKVNLPVVDFRYYNNKPVYKGTVSLNFNTSHRVEFQYISKTLLETWS